MHKLAKFSENPGKLHSEGLVYILKYISYNKTLGLKYYYDTSDAPVSCLLKQAYIDTDNQLMDFYDSSWQYFPETVRSTGAYIIFYQDGTIEHVTHIPVPVAKYV